MRIGMMTALVVATGCGPAVVGDWESQEPIEDQHNQLVVEDGSTAESTVWIFRTVGGVQTAQSFRFEVEWKERRDGEAFEFDMKCDESPYGECDEEDNFKMDCDLQGDEDQLACEVGAPSRWEAYGFAWRKLE
jgi:hypothetical protein